MINKTDLCNFKRMGKRYIEENWTKQISTAHALQWELRMNL